MEIGALVLALINLVISVLENRQATKPERDARAARKDAIDDVERLNQALRTKDPDGVATFFEQERLEAWGRPISGTDNGGVQRTRRDDSGQPQTGGQS